ncbi:hypothetical protein Vadar_031223 [Vaccinium darrowii]|uniref:Uncharacterized protein n=1 Tax=Vaccinium darrowii TaxID=229202 RepID=A0ACB7XUN4_9ERIC|nr:hypothetical protein Vadar_031223 [Vaccinium darrowii]
MLSKHLRKLQLPYSAATLSEEGETKGAVKQTFKDDDESEHIHTLHNSHPADAQLISESKLHYPLIGDRIENSCNGLLCSKNIFGYVFITNPILGEYISLPEACHVEKFDGTISAIGFSPLNNKYKVIQFSLKRDSFDPITGLSIYREEAEADIYTLGEGLWRSLGRVPYHLSKHSFNASVNGALHWLNFTADSPDFIRCFDFGSEQFQVVPEPREFGLEKKSLTNCMSVCVLRDCLAVCDFSSSLHVEIWIMKHYKIQASWCKDFVIEKVTVKGQLFSYCEPIMILKSGKILMLVNKDTLLQYNPKLGSFEDLKIYGIESRYYRAVGHIQSFVSLADVAKGERCTGYYKRKHTEILDRMWEHMKGQSSGCHKQLHVHC